MVLLRDFGCSEKRTGGWEGDPCSASVRFREGGMDVLGGQHREDVGLQEADEQLEEEDREAEQDGDRTRHVVEGVVREGQQECTAHHEHRDHQVTGEHIGEETQAERERPGDEVREELQRHDHRVQVDRHPLGDELHLHVLAEAVLADAGADVDDPGHDRQGPRVPDVGERREHEHEGLAEPVVHQQEAEQAQQIGQVAAVLRAEDVAGDTVADEAVHVLPEELTLAGDGLQLAGGEPPQRDDQSRTDHGLPERLVHPVDAERTARQVAGVVRAAHTGFGGFTEEPEIPHTGGFKNARFQRGQRSHHGRQCQRTHRSSSTSMSYVMVSIRTASSAACRRDRGCSV
ncbi:hypothetical protein SDC9_71127 [bioreactor metagenome]|uniref:Uncharacterized protein n=1 Tax=bioreactor metagenome TaxID=1076179 RepID=A0A644YES7_9ZZZZ